MDMANRDAATHEDDAPLSSRVAIVTGASSGLGRASAIALAQAGANVALLARSEGALRDVAAEIVATSGQRALPLPLDLAGGMELLTTVDTVAAELGRVDVLINAAGTDEPGPAEELTLADWDRVLAVNLRAPFALAKAAFPFMRRAGGGTIVNVSSVAGKWGWADASVYCASKFGLTGLTQALAAEGKPHGIRVSVLYPGGMATQWGTAWTPEDHPTEHRGPSPETVALPPEDVAALIVWMVSAPPALVLNEAIVSPLDEGGWP